MDTIGGLPATLKRLLIASAVLKPSLATTFTRLKDPGAVPPLSSVFHVVLLARSPLAITCQVAPSSREYNKPKVSGSPSASLAFHATETLLSAPNAPPVGVVMLTLGACALMAYCASTVLFRRTCTLLVPAGTGRARLNVVVSMGSSACVTLNESAKPSDASTRLLAFRNTI